MQMSGCFWVPPSFEATLIAFDAPMPAAWLRFEVSGHLRGHSRPDQRYGYRSGVRYEGHWGAVFRSGVPVIISCKPEGRDFSRSSEDALSEPPGSEPETIDAIIWAMSTMKTALAAHFVQFGASVDDDRPHRASGKLRQHFNAGHATLRIQNRSGAHPYSPPPRRTGLGYAGNRPLYL